MQVSDVMVVNTEPGPLDLKLSVQWPIDEWEVDFSNCVFRSAIGEAGASMDWLESSSRT